MCSQIYSNIIQVFTLFMKAIFSQVRHPSHPGRGHASPTCHMTQFEQSDWLRSENFINIMIEWGISYGIALMWISLYLTADKSALVQVMTWCPQAASQYLSKCRPRSMSTYGVTRPQWVSKLFIIFTTLLSKSFHTTVPSASMPFHSTTIFTLAYLLPLSLAHLPQQKTPFKLAFSIQKHCWRTP